MAMKRRSFLIGVGGVAATAASAHLMANPNRPTVGVVGAGIIGASVAYHLAKAGANVTVFDKRGPAAGATRNSFAWINAFSDSEHYRNLRLHGIAAYHKLDKSLSLDVTWGGSLTWEFDQGRASELSRRAAEYSKTGYPIELIGADRFSAIAPTIQSGSFDVAAYANLDGHIDPVHVTNQFLMHAGKYGARFVHPCEITDLVFAKGDLVGAMTTSGEFPLDKIVIAGGVETPVLSAKAGYTPPLKHAPGVLAHSVPTKRMTDLVVEGPTVHFKQSTNGIIVGSDSTYAPPISAHSDILQRPVDFPNDAIRDMHGTRILAKVSAVMPQLQDAALQRVTLGFRPMPVDGYPIVGFAPGSQDVYVAVMHSGVTLSPIMGQFISDEILDGSTIELLAPYRPGRSHE